MPYGKTKIPFTLPDVQRADRVMYRADEESADDSLSRQRVLNALRSPIDTPALSVLAQGKRSAAVMISDGTRLCPSHLLLPLLLDELNRGGIPDTSIDIVIALGMHRKHTREEMKRLVGDDVFSRIRVHNHSADAEDCIHLGTTTAGTPVEINRTVAKADLRVVTGNIEPHALVGVAGGVKALIPGVASQRCIEHNHSLSLRHQAVPGQPDNPIHRDLEEALQFISADFLLNVVVDHNRQVLEAVAGHAVAAHRTGVGLASARFLVPVSQTYDVTIVSPGGYPKDTQLYQSIKALRNASSMTKAGGTIIMAAECPEIFGNGMFQYWTETMDRERAVAKLKQSFQLGAHKLLHLDDILSKHRVYLHSSIPSAVIELLGILPAEQLQKCVNEVVHSRAQHVAIMPFGSMTFPQLPSVQ
nr:nickel-dependent lactate racemase [Paenibacillus konkukensis]